MSELPAGSPRPPRSAHDRALAMLARREHSCRELRRKLQRQGCPDEEIDATLAVLVEQHYLSDQRFAEMLVRSRVRQGYGPQRIRVELRSHGLDDACIATWLAEADVDWFDRAVAQLRHRYHGADADDYRERARRMQFLARRGFDAATARAAVEQG